MILRRDHIAGGTFVAAGAIILAVSHDLPFGTLASPGAGMLPMLVIGLMMLLGLVLVFQAGSSPPITDISWDDLPHAAKVTAVATAATALYGTLGFLITMALMLFALVFVIERRPLGISLAFSVLLPLTVYLSFEYLLKTPLERGPLWF